jgi:hypothetical protein
MVLDWYRGSTVWRSDQPLIFRLTFDEVIFPFSTFWVIPRNLNKSFFFFFIWAEPSNNCAVRSEQKNTIQFFRLFNYHRHCIGKVNFEYRQMTKWQMSSCRPNVKADLLEIIPWLRKTTDLASWLALSLLPLGQGQAKTLDCP